MPIHPATPVVPMQPWRSHVLPAVPAPCPYCASRRCCLPGMAAIEGAGGSPRHIAVARDEPLYLAGEPVREAVYIVRLGSFKHTRGNQCRQQRIIGFPMSGDVLALDSIGLQRYQSSMVALEDSDVCAISYTLMRACSAYFHALAGIAIARAQAVSLHLRRTRAPQKLAAFLLDLAHEFRARGFAASQYRLPMRQKDIADFLDVAPASVSRLLEQFRRRRLIDMSMREVVLCDPAGLSGVAAHGLDGRHDG